MSRSNQLGAELGPAGMSGNPLPSWYSGPASLSLSLGSEYFLKTGAYLGLLEIPEERDTLFSELLVRTDYLKLETDSRLNCTRHLTPQCPSKCICSAWCETLHTDLIE